MLNTTRPQQPGAAPSKDTAPTVLAPDRATAPSAAPPVEPGVGATSRDQRGSTVASGAWWAAAVVAAVLGVLALLSPYSRGILGEQDGSRRLVETSCAAPVIAVFDNGARQLDADGQWRSDEPPCQRSAGFRIGLGAILLLGAAGLGLRARHVMGPASPPTAAAASSR